MYIQNIYKINCKSYGTYTYIGIIITIEYVIMLHNMFKYNTIE